MKRSHRVALTAVTTTAVLTGAGTALVLGPLQTTGTATPVAGAVQADQPLAVQAADAQSLHDAVSRLEQQVGSLSTDLRTAQQQLDAANAAAAAAAAAPAPVTAAPAPVRRQAPTVRRTVTKAPAVHTRTGASASTSGEGKEHEGSDD